MSVLQANPFLFAGGGDGYEIERSLRFNSGDSSSLTRTPSSAGNRRTWTWSGWVKRSSYVNSAQAIFGAYESSTLRDVLRFTSNNLSLQIGTSSGFIEETSSAVYRDSSAWYHIIVVFDSTQATAADRVKIYVNGLEQALSGTPVSQNTESTINNSQIQLIGARQSGGSPDLYLDGYLADIHFIDGQALSPTNFGRTDGFGVWQLIEYSGTYGTNGFHLDLEDNSSNAALGLDTSGNNNNFSVNNLRVTGGNLNVDISTSLELYINKANNVSGESVYVNGIDVTSQITVGAWSTITGVGTILNSVETTGDAAGNNYYCTAAIKTNGKWLIDTGTSNPPTPNIIRDWSTNYLVYEPYASRGISFAFNGVLGTYDASFVGKVGGGGGHEVDSLRDSPSQISDQTDTGVGGEVFGNYCTLNPLDKNSNVTLSNGNLDFTAGSVANTGARSTFFITSGKYYWEITNTSGGGNFTAGIAKSSWDLVYVNGIDSFGYGSQGIFYPSSSFSTPSAANTAGDVIGVAFDADNGTLDIYLNGTSLNTAAGWGTIPFGPWTPAFGSGQNVNNSINFGQRAFSYPVSGYKSLNTANLPEPTIADGSEYFDTKLWTGSGVARSITMDNTEMSPDFVWIKDRNGGGDHHHLFDTVRGAGKRIFSNLTNVETTDNNTLSAFGSNGFSLGTQTAVNGNGDSVVAWVWDAGSSTVSNNVGSIDSQVRANPSAGFSICSYTGNGIINSTIGHGLNAAPEFIIIKNRSNLSDWSVLHTSAGTTGTTLDGSPEYYMLQLSQSQGRSNFTNDNIWNPTSSTFKINGEGTGSWVNASGNNYIAYCFAPVTGYSAFGSYVANNTTPGPFVHLNFKPAFVMVKRITTGGPWYMFDAERSSHNAVRNQLVANDSTAEFSGSPDRMDFLSNGFSLKSGASDPNSTGTYIYVAFASHPFKTARAH